MSIISGYLLRPLLSTTKKGILDYATAHSIEFREDSSNTDINYDRNRIRQDINPVLELLNPSVHSTMGDLSEYMQDLAIYLSSQVENWLQTAEQES